MEKIAQKLRGHGGGEDFWWEFTTREHARCWQERHYDPERYWGDFDRQSGSGQEAFPSYALAHFEKHGTPVLAPSPGRWDCGRFGGGVHNGSILVKDGLFYYVYRGE